MCQVWRTEEKAAGMGSNWAKTSQAQLNNETLQLTWCASSPLEDAKFTQVFPSPGHTAHKQPCSCSLKGVEHLEITWCQERNHVECLSATMNFIN